MKLKMVRGLGIGLRLLFVIILSITASDARAQVESPDYSSPLGIALETYTYPYPVRFLSLEIDRQPIRMAYMDAQPVNASNGRTIVLLHGKNFYGSYWEDTIKKLTAAGYRVIVPDQIGFGKSGKPAVDYSFDLLAANTLQLLDHLRVGRVVALGHSMGGMLAVRFARNYPERTTHLVLENPIGLEDYRFKVPPQTTEKIYQNELNQTDPGKIRDFLRRYVVEWKPEAYERFVQVRARITLSGEYERWAWASALTYQTIYREPVRHEFGLIRVPTLLIIGQEDRTTLGRGLVSEDVLKTLGQYPQLGREAAKDIPGATLVEMNGVGHIPHLEAPDKFHKALLEFLNRQN